MNAKGKGKRKWKLSQKARFSVLQNEKSPTEDLQSGFLPSSAVMNCIPHIVPVRLLSSWWGKTVCLITAVSVSPSLYKYDFFSHVLLA